MRGTVTNIIVGWAGVFQGDVLATGGYFVSDERWKKDIRPLEELSIPEKVMQLKPKSYQWKADEFPGMGFDPERTSFGFVAQEMISVFPELVNTNKLIDDPTQPHESRSEAKPVGGYHFVDYVGMVPILTQAIQEQQQLIEELQQVIQKLSQRLDAVESGQSSE